MQGRITCPLKDMIMADHHDDSEYEHGQMDVHQQQHSYDLFASLTKWCSLYLAITLVFLVILTCTKLGFITALVAAVVVAAAGWFMLKKKPDASH